MTVATPVLNLETLNQYEKGTADYGTAVLHAQMLYIQNIVRWALESHVQGLLNGKHDQGRGCDINRIGMTVREYIKFDEKESYELLMEDWNEEMTTATFLTLEVIKYMQKTGEVSYDDGKLFPNWEIEQEDQDGKVVLDGIEYPIVAELAPGEIMRYGQMPESFAVDYPNGNFNMIQATGRHLMEGQVDVVQQEMDGKTFYMYSA